jgi:hypothetical protein
VGNALFPMAMHFQLKFSKEQDKFDFVETGTAP